MRGYWLAAVSLSLACLLAAVPAKGQTPPDGRENPFLPPTSEDELRELRREETRRIVRDMMPEIRSQIAPDLAQTRTQIEDQLRKAVAEASSRPVGGSAAGAPGAPGAGGSRLPPTAKFQACLNGRAIYRDSADGQSFFVEKGPQIARYPCPD